MTSVRIQPLVLLPRLLQVAGICRLQQHDQLMPFVRVIDPEHLAVGEYLGKRDRPRPVHRDGTRSRKDVEGFQHVAEVLVEFRPLLESLRPEVRVLVSELPEPLFLVPPL